MAKREFIGRLDDTFVFTAHNDVITWSRADGLRKTETNLVDLEDADLFSDGIIVGGFAADGTAEISHVDIDGEITALYTSGYQGHPFDIISYESVAFVTLDSYTIGVYADWSVAADI